MEEEKVGKVVKYFAKPQAAAISLQGEICVGDTIHIKGQTTDLTQVIESMHIENESVEKAKAGDDVGVKVNERVRPNDIVYRVSEG